MQINLQTRSRNALTELGEKIFLDRYAIKDTKKETFKEGDTVVVCVNLKTGQREIGVAEKIDWQEKTVNVRLRDGSIEVRAIDHVDKPLELIPENMFDRVAKHIASVEKTDELKAVWEKKFRESLDDFKYVPAGRIYTGSGTGQNLTFYNCYVIPSPKDTRHGIFDTLSQMAEIMSRGGGVGINVSTLRPRYAYVKGVNGRSSGSVSWASLYSFVTGLIEQGGSRRGALMLILNVWHPDVLDFINSKREAGKITNANISVGVTDDFMKAVKEDADYDLIFPDTQDPKYDAHWTGDIRKWKEIGGSIIKYKTVKAREVWSQIIESAWMSAEPGVYFIDRANYYSNSWYFAGLPCTNPCGEQPLPEWGVCNLGHINLSRFVDKEKKQVLWDELKEAVYTAVRFQDNVIDATPYFFDENYKQQMSERRVGMGTIGLAEMLIYMELRYGSPEAVAFIDQLYRHIAVSAYEASVNLAKEKGAFEKFEAEKFLQSGYMKNMPDHIRSLVSQHGIRNVTIMTQAPTGTVGTMAGTSTGIEPFFSWKYFRKSRLGVHEENIPIAQHWLEKNPGKELPKYFTTAMELTPEEHVRVQAAVQKWTDSAISKTCNAPQDYTIEQTKQLYELMYDLGCKGGTIYRDGSRDEQILATDANKLGKDVREQLKDKLESDLKEKQEVAAKASGNGHAPKVAPEMLSMAGKDIQVKIAARERPQAMAGITYNMKTAYGHLYVTINEDGDGPFEVFAYLGKTGGFFQAQTEAMTRLISLALRSNVAVEEIISQLKGIRGPDVSFVDGEMIFSLPDAVGKVLERHIKRAQKQIHEKYVVDGSITKIETDTDKPQLTLADLAPQVTDKIEAVVTGNVQKQKKPSMASLGSNPICPSCSNLMIFAEGCTKCEMCGYSKCG